MQAGPFVASVVALVTSPYTFVVELRRLEGEWLPFQPVSYWSNHLSRDDVSIGAGRSSPSHMRLGAHAPRRGVKEIPAAHWLPSPPWSQDQRGLRRKPQ